MKIHTAASPTLMAAAWLRRYATALIVIAMVSLGTLGVGVAQALYSNAALQAGTAKANVTMQVALDQHERRAINR